MPWYIAAILFLLSPVYTILVRDKFWPRLRDWWATRSNKALLKRIETLEKGLTNAQSLPLLTEVEDQLLLALQRTRISIGMAVHLIIGCLLVPLVVFAKSLGSAVGFVPFTVAECAFLGI